MSDALEGRVLRIIAGVYTVEVDGQTLPCSLRGRLRSGDDGPIAVGDCVQVEPVSGGSGRILARLPRRSVLARRGPSGRAARVIAANVDGVAAVTSVARPDPDFRLVDRILVLAEVNGVRAMVVVNKVDLLTDDGTHETSAVDAAGRPSVPPGFESYEAAGYPVIGTSATAGTGLDALVRQLSGRVTAFTGASGAGKSSLANRLIPGASLRVGEVSGRPGRGRQTTVSASLIPLPGGGYLADTPGFQFLGLGPLPARALAAAFPELRSHAHACRFSDCRHRDEPECAVRAAVERGDASARRYDTYLTLLAGTVDA